jgi:zinc/manganese transport system permease protein
MAVGWSSAGAHRVDAAQRWAPSVTAVAVLGPLQEMLSHDYMRHALLAGTFIALAAGLVGEFVVLRNQVFTGDALSHVAFTGSLAGYAAGVQPLVGLYVATVASALGMGSLGGRGRGRDVVIGTVFAWILGVGVLFNSIYTSAHSATTGAAGVHVLFGSIYGISGGQAVEAVVIGCGVSAALLLLGRPLLLASVDPDIAAARGIPVRLVGFAFLALVGVTVGEAVQAVGAMLIVGLLVTPAATAQRLTARPFVALAAAAGISVGVLWLGLVIAYHVPRVPPSVPIVGLAFAAYLAATLRRSGRPRSPARSTAPPASR